MTILTSSPHLAAALVLLKKQQKLRDDSALAKEKTIGSDKMVGLILVFDFIFPAPLSSSVMRRFPGHPPRQMCTPIR